MRAAYAILGLAFIIILVVLYVLAGRAYAPASESTEIRTPSSQ